VEHMTIPETRKERIRREAEELKAQAVEESKPVVLDPMARLAEVPKQRTVEESFFDPRFREMDPFNDLMTASEVVPDKPVKKGRFDKTAAEWRHAMLMELLRVPIMVPIWWGGMQLCDVFWKHR
jgi:hypothetical protein